MPQEFDRTIRGIRNRERSRLRRSLPNSPVYLPLDNRGERNCLSSKPPPSPPSFSERCDSKALNGWGSAKDVILKDLSRILPSPHRTRRLAQARRRGTD